MPTKFPEVVFHRFGKGRAIYCASVLEDMDNVRDVFIRLLRRLQPTATGQPLTVTWQVPSGRSTYPTRDRSTATRNAVGKARADILTREAQRGRAVERDVVVVVEPGEAAQADLAAAGPLLARLRPKVGRLIINGFPTGVEVCHAMNHGGPYPAIVVP